MSSCLLRTRIRNVGAVPLCVEFCPTSMGQTSKAFIKDITNSNSCFPETILPRLKQLKQQTLNKGTGSCFLLQETLCITCFSTIVSWDGSSPQVNTGDLGAAEFSSQSILCVSTQQRPIFRKALLLQGSFAYRCRAFGIGSLHL